LEHTKRGRGELCSSGKPDSAAFVDLPLRAVVGVTAEAYSADRLPMKTEPLYIAVVDDDENFCRALGRLLLAAGMQSISYASGEAFLEDTKHPRFDCLLLDIQLGGMSGIELGQRLMTEGRYAPFIYITDHDDSKARKGAEAAGCAAFFRKTDPGAHVLDAIRRVAGTRSRQ
jgi:FixJ family two-component response regulator